MTEEMSHLPRREEIEQVLRTVHEEASHFLADLDDQPVRSEPENNLHPNVRWVSIANRRDSCSILLQPMEAARRLAMKSKGSTPVRIDTDLYAAATDVASVMSRSTAQQIVHWARIGRELESAVDVSIDRIADVLRGRESYDELAAEEQAVVRAYWRERMEGLTEALRLDREFASEGRPYVELDDEGEVVRRSPEATP